MKTMKTITYTLVMFMLLLLQSATAQVAINLNGSQPDSPAILDVQSNSMGIYVPRVQLTGNTDQTTVSVATNADTSLLVFNLNLAGTTATDSVFPGFYYWSGTIWQKLATGEHDDWHLSGNTGTDPSINFVGTTDNKNLMFRQNNIEHFRMTTKGQLEVLNTGYSVFIGEGAGKNDDLNYKQNVYIGYNAGNSSISGKENVAIGVYSLTDNTIGYENVAIGAYSLTDNTTGNYNSAVGWGALWYNTTGYENIAFGHEALQSNTTGNYNIGFGTLALGKNKTGRFNVVIGDQAAGGANTGADNLNNNTILGFQGGVSMANGADNNILLGFRAADELTTGANNIMIGYNIGAQSITGNNQLSIGNILFGSGGFGVGTTVGTGNIGIGEPNPDEKLHVAGKVKIDDMISGSSTDSIVVWNPADSILKVLAAPYGRNVQSSVGTTDVTVPQDAFASVPQLSITFTPRHSVVFVSFSIAGDVSGDSNGDIPVGLVARLLLNGTTITGTNTMASDISSAAGFVTAYNMSVIQFPVAVTPGTSITLNVQWFYSTSSGVSRDCYNYCVTGIDYSHRNITIWD